MNVDPFQRAKALIREGFARFGLTAPASPEPEEPSGGPKVTGWERAELEVEVHNTTRYSAELAGKLKAKLAAGIEDGQSREELLQMIAEARRELERQKRHLAFLSIDVINSTGMKVGEDPDIIERDFRRYRRLVERAVFNNNGLKTSWTPDGVMICFTTVDAAVAAAKEVIRQLRAFNRDVRAMRSEFKVRCGVNAGEIIFDRRMPLEELKNRTIDIAGHLQQHAGENAIYIPEHVFKELRHQLDFGPAGKQVDGLQVYVWDGTRRETPRIEEDPPAAVARLTLGRYEVKHELGRGAMGIVYLGRDPVIKRDVAIKTLKLPEVECTSEGLQELRMRFFREAESAGNLNHPNIVQVFGADEERGTDYIAMELLQGHDLTRHCSRDHRLDLAVVLDCGRQIAEALDYAHQNGVIHRDVKPGNIMLLDDGSLRITDFGVARVLEASRTATGAILGTPSYMSPEQVMGAKVDGRADIWGLGVTLYELLTCEKPFDGDSVGALLLKIVQEDPPPPTQFREDLPEQVATVISKALKKEPDDRYQKAAELAADLGRALDALKGSGDDGV